MGNFMDTSVSLKELREEDIDTVSAGKNLHFGKLHFGNKPFGNNVVQTNTAVQIAVASGGSVVQIIGQSNTQRYLITDARTLVICSRRRALPRGVKILTSSARGRYYS